MQSDVKILQDKTFYKGFVTLKSYRLQHRLFNGGWSEPFEREILQRLNAVAVLPYDIKLDRVVLVEQFRAGVLLGDDKPWLLEVVAGVIDKDMPKEEIAILEAKEEAGLKIQQLLPITEYWSSPGAMAEKVALFCGLVDASQAGGIHGIDEENEDIKVHVLTSEEAFAAVKKGAINNAATIIALQWLELNRDKVRSYDQ